MSDDLNVRLAIIDSDGKVLAADTPMRLQTLYYSSSGVIRGLAERAFIEPETSASLLPPSARVRDD